MTHKDPSKRPDIKKVIKFLKEFKLKLSFYEKYPILSFTLTVTIPLAIAAGILVSILFPPFLAFVGGVFAYFGISAGGASVGGVSIASFIVAGSTTTSPLLGGIFAGLLAVFGSCVTKIGTLIKETFSPENENQNNDETTNNSYSSIGSSLSPSNKKEESIIIIVDEGKTKVSQNGSNETLNSSVVTKNGKDNDFKEDNEESSSSFSI